jgi:hypothetical protein
MNHFLQFCNFLKELSTSLVAAVALHVMVEHPIAILAKNFLEILTRQRHQEPTPEK